MHIFKILFFLYLKVLFTFKDRKNETDFPFASLLPKYLQLQKLVRCKPGTENLTGFPCG